MMNGFMLGTSLHDDCTCLPARLPPPLPCLPPTWYSAQLVPSMMAEESPSLDLRASFSCSRT